MSSNMNGESLHKKIKEKMYFSREAKDFKKFGGTPYYWIGNKNILRNAKLSAREIRKAGFFVRVTKERYALSKQVYYALWGLEKR